jgi:hypothetical protein
VLPRSTVEYLKAWILSPEHINHPYPTEKEKEQIMNDTGIEMKQLTNWFVNNRKRFWKPRVEAQMQNQVKTSPAPVRKRIEGHTPVSTGFPPAQVHFSSLENQNGMLRISGNQHDLQLKVNIATKPNTFGPTTRGYVPNTASQIVSLGSTCSFSSESDTHSINSDDQMFSQEIKSDHPYQRRIMTGNDGTASYDKFEEDNSFGTPTLRMKKSEVRAQNSPRYSTNRRRSILYVQSSLSDIIEPSSKRRFFQGWQGACQSAHHGYDNTLPSLEEAATLFGFSPSTH